MPYDVARAMRYAQPVTSFINGRDNARQNALVEQQAADLQAQQQATQQNALFNQQRLTAADSVAAQEREQAAQQEQHKKLFAAMQSLAAVSNDPVKFQGLSQRFLSDPELAPVFAENGVTPEDMTPANVHELLDASGVKIGQGPAAPEEFTLGPGQKRFVNGKEVAAVAPNPSKGMRIQSDGAGGFSLYEGPDASGVDLTNPSKNLLQTGAINAQAGIDRLSGIRQGFDPRWLTYTEQAKQYMNSVRAKAAGLPFVSKLSPQEESDLSAFSRFKSDTTDNLNRYITEITGSAMGVDEAKRIVSTMPSLNDSPQEFQTKLNRVEERLKLVIARSVYTQRQGIKFDAIPVDRMRDIMNKRGDELYQQHLQQLKDPNAAKQATVEALNSEFYQ